MHCRKSSRNLFFENVPVADAEMETDKRVLDTSLAKSYLEDNNKTFYYSPNATEENTMLDNYKNKILYTQDDARNNYEVNENIDSNKLRALATEIEANSDLFAQLDYLIRKRSIIETKQCDIVLMRNNLHFLSATPDFTLAYRAYNTYKMCEVSRLADLTCCMRAVWTPVADSVPIVLEVTRNVAVVSYLFKQLCESVGININLRINTNESDVPPQVGRSSWCMGVISDRSDIDSAVCTLLNYSYEDPWKLQRIVVQESIYDRFKKIVSWETRSMKQNVDTSLKCQCTDVYMFKDKILLVDYVGSEDLLKNEHEAKYIQVEAYRTTKELLDMTKEYDAYCISLWNSFSAEINEISFAVNSNIVWINEIGNFNGLPKTSEAYYSNLQIPSKYSNEIEKLMLIHGMWKKRDVENQLEVFCDALRTCFENSDFVSMEYHAWMKYAQHVAFNRHLSKCLDVSNNRLCVTDDCPGLLYANMFDVEVVASVLLGNFVVVDTESVSNKSIIKRLSASGIPIIADNLQTPTFDTALFKTKAIFSNFGTIFAN